MPSTSKPLSFVPKEPYLLQNGAHGPLDETGSENTSASTFCVGLRVVRGPDWRSDDAGSDGGEGFVGTVVEVGSDSFRLAENMARVQWDIGPRAAYKAGFHGKHEISVLDNSSVGIKHEGIICCSCKQTPIVGMRWNCLDCKASRINLCTSCYMADEHETEHAFLRFDASGGDGIPVERRSTGNKIQARGIYRDAIVTRGSDWEYGDQDGGRFGTVTEITSWQRNPASAARVKWNSGTEGTYRLGYQGKVDLQCVSATSGGHYYKSHLPRLGASQKNTDNAEKNSVNEPGCSTERGDLTGEHSSESSRSVCGISDDTPTQTSEESVAEHSSDCAAADDDSQKPTTDCERRAEDAKASRSALHKAAIAGQWEAVKMLLDHGDDVNQRDKFSLTPLHLAAWYGQESIVKLLLERGADVNAKDRFQKTPLQKAERHNYQSVMKTLKEHGATSSYQQPLSLKSFSKTAVLAVDQASGFNILQAAVFEGHFNMVVAFSVFLDNFLREMSFESTANNAKNSPSKTACDMFSTLRKQDHAKIKSLYEETFEKVRSLTALHQCRDSDDVETAVELVLHHGMNVNIPATGNRTPLLWSSLRSSSMLIQTLLDLGADVSDKREDTCTPLELAVDWNNYMVVRLLIEYGTDANVTTRHGGTALHRAVRFGGHDVTELLIKSGCNVNTQDNNGKTPLHLATENKSTNGIKLLLENGADVNVRSMQNTEERVFLVRGKDKGKAAWHYVLVDKALLGSFRKYSKGGNIDVAKFGTVLASGWGQDPPDSKREEMRVTAAAQVFPEMKDKTALHFACEKGDEQVIELLVRHGADVNVCDADGFTPLQLAAIQGNMSVVKKLVKLKADVNLTTTDGKDAADYAHLNEEMEIEAFLKSKKSSFRKLWKKFSRKH